MMICNFLYFDRFSISFFLPKMRLISLTPGLHLTKSEIIFHILACFIGFIFSQLIHFGIYLSVLPKLGFFIFINYCLLLSMF